MKATISLWITTLMFFCTLGTVAAHATSASNTASRRSVEVTGCLEQGPTAKEYLLKTSDGTTWGINETDMLMNNYVDHTVTISGGCGFDATLQCLATERSFWTASVRFTPAFNCCEEARRNILPGLSVS